MSQRGSKDSKDENAEEEEKLYKKRSKRKSGEEEEERVVRKSGELSEVPFVKSLTWATGEGEETTIKREIKEEESKLLVKSEIKDEETEEKELIFKKSETFSRTSRTSNKEKTEKDELITRSRTDVKNDNGDDELFSRSKGSLKTGRSSGKIDRSSIGIQRRSGQEGRASLRSKKSSTGVVEEAVEDEEVIREREREEARQKEVTKKKEEIRKAKEVLMSVTVGDGASIYQHLTAIVKRVLTEKPKDAIDAFEEFSRREKREKFKEPDGDLLQDVWVPPLRLQVSERLKPLLITPKNENEEAEDEDLAVEMARPDLLQIFASFEQTGVSLPRTELFCIQLAMRQITRTQPVEQVRFWGKILGLGRNYYIVEAELMEEERLQREQQKEEEEAARQADEEEAAEAKQRAEEEEEADDDEIGKMMKKVEPKLPQSTYKPPPVVPQEATGTGINKKVFYVCNELGEPWTELPDATPQQINVSRKIKRYLTGNLDAPVESFPPFPGKETNYLRAQIARISAGTQVSPMGYYQFDEEEEEDENEDNARQTFVENPEFEPMPVKDLADASMTNWVHHTPHILDQGRTTWWNPKSGKEHEEEEEEEEEPENPVEPETGPPLLTPLSEDATTEATPAWTTFITSRLMPDFAVAVVRSNLWPGAAAFATGRKFENIYIGWGLKYKSHNFSPVPMPPILSEYRLGPEITEMTDPSVEEEEAFKLAHTKPEEDEEAEEENEDEEEEDEEDEED